MKNLKYLSPSTINEIIRGYEESKRIQEEALYQTWLSAYPDGKFPAPNPTPAPPEFKAQPAQPSVEILIPPKVAGYEDIEIFPEITKDPSGNIIIDFPVELGSLGGCILWTPPSEFKNRFYDIVGFPAVQRDMKDYILYSGSGGKTVVKFKNTTTKGFWKDYNKLPNEMQKLADKQFELFKQNPKHPSLNFENLPQYGKNVWSVRINSQYRAMGRMVGNTIEWYAITNHYAK